MIISFRNVFAHGPQVSIYCREDGICCREVPSGRCDVVIHGREDIADDLEAFIDEAEGMIFEGETFIDGDKDFTDEDEGKVRGQEDCVGWERTG